MKPADLGWDDVFESQFQPHREQGYVPARVASQQKTEYITFSELGELPADLPRRFLHKKADRSELPAVGDWVAIRLRPDEGRATIQAVLPRKTHFSRNVAGYRSRRAGGLVQQQVLVANIDTVFLVVGLDPDFNLRRIERYRAMAAEAEVAPVIVLNKTDLCDDVPGRIAGVETVAVDAPIHAVSALANEGMGSLRRYLEPGHTIVLLGSSGVGKSTIINCLLHEERLAVGKVRKGDSRGTHTTTRRELIRMPGGGLVIDTPGLRELQIQADEESLEEAFFDVEQLAGGCRFRDCTHQDEPACAVLEAVADGALEEGRLRSYQKLQKERRHLAIRKEQGPDHVEKTKWKKIRVAYKKQHKKR